MRLSERDANMCVDCILGVVKVHLGRSAHRSRVSATRSAARRGAGRRAQTTLHNAPRVRAGRTA